MKKRTSIDFSKHELIIKKYSLCKIHWLKHDESMIYNVKFIHIANSFIPELTDNYGIMLVTGDFGRWSFCRDFNPENCDISGISDEYWCEKIELGSKQETKIFDSEIAKKSINEKIDEILQNSEIDDDNIYFENNEKKKQFNFWNNILSYCNDIFELKTYFRQNKPNSLDFDSFPVCTKQNSQLDAIFDAFEEIIRRLS